MQLLDSRPASRPGLGVMDYAIWGTLASRAAEENPVPEIDLEVTIRRAFPGLGLAVIRKSIYQFARRLDVCIEWEGGLSEYTLRGK